MTSKQQKPSLRLLIRDEAGHEKAIPLNDEVEIKSGLNPHGIPYSVREEINYDKFKYSYQDDKNYTTINAGDNNFVLTLGIKKIFSKVAKAQKSGSPLVDLTGQSGFDAILKHIKVHPPSNAGRIYARLSEFFNGAAEIHPKETRIFKNELEVYRRALLEKDTLALKTLEKKAQPDAKLSARSSEANQVLKTGYEIYTSWL